MIRKEDNSLISLLMRSSATWKAATFSSVDNKINEIGGRGH